MKPILLVAFALGTLAAQELPGWWKALPELPHLESRFLQESESAVFGKIQRQGLLQMSRGGRIRVAYDQGLLIVSDGRMLVQYDSGARTAQKSDLRTVAQEMPLIRILLEPKALGEVYRAKSLPGGRLALEPRRAGLPKVEVQGKGQFLKKILWTDPTGARQVLELVDPRGPATIPDSTYKIRVPEGTRWLR